MPQSTASCWQLMDQEISSEVATRGYEDKDYTKKYINPDKELFFCKLLVQQEAALHHNDPEKSRQEIIKRLGLLSLTRPTQNMQKAGKAAIFASFAMKLIEKEYCHYSIMKGIDDFDDKDDGDFFPNIKKLINYISPLNYKAEKRAKKLEEMLLRLHKNQIKEKP